MPVLNLSPFLAAVILAMADGCLLTCEQSLCICGLPHCASPVNWLRRCNVHCTIIQPLPSATLSNCFKNSVRSSFPLRLSNRISDQGSVRFQCLRYCPQRFHWTAAPLGLPPLSPFLVCLLGVLSGQARSNLPARSGASKRPFHSCWQ